MKSQIIRFIPLLVLAVLMCQESKAQINNYGFTSTSGTFTSISTSGVALALSPDANNGRTTPLLFSNVFPFEYEGKQAYSLSMSANGFLGLSFSSTTTPLSTLQAAVSNPFTNSFTASANCIAPFGANLLGISGSTSYCFYQLDGTAPNRVLTLEWINFSLTGSGDIFVPANANFQAKLYEGSNMIEFVYGTLSPGTRTVSTTVQIGLKGASTNAYNMNAVSGTLWTSLSGNGTSASTVTVGAGVDQLPTVGQTLRFTPEAACTGTPSAATAAKTPISFCTSGSFALSLSSFQKNVYTGYQWQVSTDGTTGWANTGANDTIPLAYATPVISSTRYYRCRAICRASGDSSFSNVIEALIGDTINPQITPTSDIVVNTDAGLCAASVAVTNAVATDNCTVQSVSYVISGATTGSGSGQVGTQSFNKGVSTITYTVADAVGLSATASMTVTVNDAEAPAISASNQTFSTDAGQCTAVAAVADAVFSDNCAVQSTSWVVSGESSGSGSGQVGTFTFNKGANTVTYTAIDASGNSSTSSITVTINDTEDPAVSAPAAITVNNDAGQCLASVAVPDAVFSDNCSGSSIAFALSGATTQSSTAGQVGTLNFNQGVTTITYTATDASGRTSTSSTTVTVVDNVAPSPVCKNITVNLNASGTVSILASDLDNGTTDNCTFSLSASKTTFTCADRGDNTVTLTATDVEGNTASCTATVTVVDNIAPAAVCKNITVALDASGAATIAAADIDDASSDNCSVSLSASKTSFTCADLGANSVTLTVTDPAGNSSSCTAVVTIVDNTAPTASCANISVYLDATGNGSITAAQLDNGTSDNCSFTLAASKTSFDCSNAGANTVVLTATDQSGNANSCNATVTVIDTVAPVASCKNITINLDVNGNATISGSDIDDNSSDACGIASRVASKSSFGCGDVGANTVVLTVTDNHGNSSTCSATVTVVDNIAPVANCKNITVTLDGSGNASIVAADIDDSSTDACDISLSASKTSFTCSDIGANNVVLTVTDASGNSSSCTAVVTVQNILAAPASITGTLNACLAGVSGTASFSIADVATATSYVWSVPSGMTIASGQGSTSITVSYTAAAIQAGITGQLCVLASNSCSQSPATCGNVSYQVAAPVTPGSISGPGKLCPGEQATFSIASVARATSYSWTLPANMTVVSGAGTNVLVVGVEPGYSGGSIAVTASNVCGTSASRSKALVLNLPATPSAISGQKEGLCNQAGTVYSIPAVPNATGYTWSVSGGTIQSGQGTTSITVDFGSFTTGSVSVYASNGCGNSSTRITTLKAAPGRAGVISGTTSYCTGGTSAHGVATVTGADNYNWSMTSGGYITGGNGTKNISVQWLSTASSSQSISVSASNACGSGTNRVLSGITVSTCPRIGETGSSALGLIAMPNPTSDLVTLRFNSEETSEYTVTLFDLAGRTLMTDQVQAMSGVNQVELSLGTYAAGTYLVRVWNGSQVEQLRITLEK